MFQVQHRIRQSFLGNLMVAEDESLIIYERPGRNDGRGGKTQVDHCLPVLLAGMVM